MFWSKVYVVYVCILLYYIMFSYFFLGFLWILYYYGIREDSAPDSKARPLPASVLFLQSRDYKERYTSENIISVIPYIHTFNFELQ